MSMMLKGAVVGLGARLLCLLVSRLLSFDKFLFFQHDMSANVGQSRPGNVYYNICMSATSARFLHRYEDNLIYMKSMSATCRPMSAHVFVFFARNPFCCPRLLSHACETNAATITSCGNHGHGSLLDFEWSVLWWFSDFFR